MATRSLASFFVAVVGFVAALAVGAAMYQLSEPDSADLAIAAIFTLLMAAATIRPVHLGFRLNVDLTTMLIIAIALSLSPSLAVLAAALGVFAGQLFQHTTTSGVIFNSGQVVWQMSVAVWILAAFDWRPANPAFDDGGFLPVMALAMLAVFVVNTTLVSIVIGLQSRIPPWLIWKDTITTDLLIEQVSQFALGVVTAIVVAVQVLILPLLAAPGIVLYIAASRKSQLQFQTHDAIGALADLVDQRDPYTSDHSRRVAILAREIATRLQLPPEEIVAIERAARVHDLGKLVIDLALLNKDGRLTDKEWEQFKRHPANGANILTWFPIFRASTLIVRHHHERWDGNGYPDGLAGDEIPLGARILAVADAFDAMSSARPYRNMLTPDAILAEFARYKNVQWDSMVVDALFALIDTGAIELAHNGSVPQVYDGLGEVIHSS